MRCPSCRSENAAGAKFCAECGARLLAVCRSCGHELTAGARFCAECGAPVAAARPDLEAQFATMQRSMPSAFRDRLLAAPEGENRILTVLFADLTSSVGSTVELPPEDAAALVDDVLRAMVDAVLEHDGRINRLLGDAVLAFFGTPVAHENDPERAILAALRIREAVQRLGRNVTAGVNTGEVYLGQVGSEAHREVTAMGTAINMAARLRERAQPGEILVGEATYRQTRRAFAFLPRGVEAKGFAEPVTAYLVEGRLEHPEKVRGIEGLRADLIGREEELGKLRDALDELGRGRGSMVALVGEAGVGKSRLVADLKELALASPSPPLWLEGRCLDVGMAVSYWPFLDLFRAGFAFTIGDDEAGRAGKVVGTLRRLVDDGALDEARFRELVPLLADLLSVELGPEWPRVAHSGPEQARQQTFLAIRDVVLALARRRGFVLVLDDLHWADGLSLDVVSLLMESITLVPLLLLCVYRDDREHRVGHLGQIAARKCAGRYDEIRLRELTPEQSRRLIASLLRIDDLPPAVSETILEKAQGNPFFVEEVVRALIDAGAVYRAGDAWRARPGIDEVAVPESIQSVILSRVDRLQEETKRVLQGAAVIGRVFRRRVLAHVTRREAELERALWELEERALIYEGRVTPEPEYSFQHQLTQDTVYRNILRRNRASFHRDVAEAIEALYEGDLEEFYEQLAYHYDRAEVPEKAFAYLVRSAEKATAGNALQQAVGYYDRALQLAPAEAAEAVRLARARCQLELFRGQRAAADFESVLEAARRRGDRGRELGCLLGLARALYVVSLDDRAGDAVDRSRELYETAYELARELGDKRRMVEALLGTRWMGDTWPGYWERTLANAREAAALSEEIGDDELRLESRIVLAQTLPRAEAEALRGPLMRELGARRDLPRLNSALFGALVRAMNSGDFEEGVGHGQAAIRVAADLGVPPVQYPTFVAICLLGLGRYGEAWRSLQHEVADDEHPFGRAVRDLGIGLYFLEVGAYERAAELLRDVAARARHLRRLWMEAWAESALARALARGGRAAEVDRLELIAKPGGARVPRRDSALAETLLAAGEVDAAADQANRAAALADEAEAAHERVVALEVAARARLRQGRPDEALAAADEGLTVAEPKGYRPLVWRLRATRAGALTAQGRESEAAEERRKAASLVEELAAGIEDAGLRASYLAAAKKGA